MQARHVMTRSLETVHPETTILEAVRRMGEAADRPMVVKEGDRLCGIVTRADLRRGVIESSSPSECAVQEIMATGVARCGEDTAVERMRELVKDDEVDHLLVFDRQQRLVGLVPAGYMRH